MLLIEPKVADRFTDAPPLLASPLDQKALDRIQYLAPPDRLLFELALQQSLSRRQIGTLMGIAPGSVTRKLRRLVGRLHDPLIVAMTDRLCTLPPEHRAIGIEYFLQRRRMRELSRRHRLSVTQIRAIIQYIHGWHLGRSARR